MKLGVFYCPKQSSTENLAGDFAHRLLLRDVIILQGDIGAGKTTFARALINAVAVSPCVARSPTFPFVQEYEVIQGRLLHYDFYRLREEKEIFDFDFEEALSRDIILIEWAERIPCNLLPKHGLTIRFEMRPMGRLLYISGSNAWRARIESLAFPAC
ncbi:MAG: tRNA (adenosine(37)-N6)-threonylcarbamoyltransferase complex ATPase subunit type 1 TsaE [Holosporales bacterium]|jgi:tRNA threonylcarbamoyl adenosine modification protein YjeE|nr:tRNA (adenosine(37)-N6)-threonylcarbamoyltransferase complex ATPase subunit type 1 TsaE [Holosporales bacterium]